MKTDTYSTSYNNCYITLHMMTNIYNTSLEN